MTLCHECGQTHYTDIQTHSESCPAKIGSIQIASQILPETSIASQPQGLEGEIASSSAQIAPSSAQIASSSHQIAVSSAQPVNHSTTDSSSAQFVHSSQIASSKSFGYHRCYIAQDFVAVSYDTQLAALYLPQSEYWVQRFAHERGPWAELRARDQASFFTAIIGDMDLVRPISYNLVQQLNPARRPFQPRDIMMELHGRAVFLDLGIVELCRDLHVLAVAAQNGRRVRIQEARIVHNKIRQLENCAMILWICILRTQLGPLAEYLKGNFVNLASPFRQTMRITTTTEN